MTSRQCSRNSLDREDRYSLFLFGAGASHSTGVFPFPPALGKNLAESIDWSSRVGQCIKRHEDVFRNRFEDGMRLFWDTCPAEVSNMLRDMGFYFSLFRLERAHPYSQLLKGLKKSALSCTFATTNYDLLLEQAVLHTPFSFCYSLTPETPAVTILKLHGSSNFFPSFIHDNFKIGSISVTPYGSAIVEAPVVVVQTTREIHELCRTKSGLPPAIGIYGPDKPLPVCGGFIRQQQAFFKEKVENAKAIIIVGLRVHPPDAHIWEPLARSRGRLVYVGLESDRTVFNDWKQSVNRTNADFLQGYFKDVVPELVRLAAS